MKIPETNLYCTFYYQQLKLNKKVHTVEIESCGTNFTYHVNTYERAKSMAEVPYWRLYIVKFKKIQTEYGDKMTREVVYKSLCNYDFYNVCDLIRRIGDPNENYSRIKGERYSYECWPRKTVLNRT